MTGCSYEQSGFIRVTDINWILQHSLISKEESMILCFETSNKQTLSTWCMCNLVVILYYWRISEEISLTQCYYHKIFASNPRDKTIICLQSQRVCVGRWLGHMIFQGSASAKGLAWLRVSLVTTSFYWRYIVGTGLAAWERVLWLVKLVLSSIFFGPK